MSSLSFGPQITKGGFISSLKRKAFAIEFTEDKFTSYLLLDEKINDEDFFWKDFNKIEEETNINHYYWTVYV